MYSYVPIYLSIYLYKASNGKGTVNWLSMNYSSSRAEEASWQQRQACSKSSTATEHAHCQEFWILHMLSRYLKWQKDSTSKCWKKLAETGLVKPVLIASPKSNPMLTPNQWQHLTHQWTGRKHEDAGIQHNYGLYLLEDAGIQHHYGLHCLECRITGY